MLKNLTTKDGLLNFKLKTTNEGIVNVEKNKRVEIGIRPQLQTER